MNDEENQFGGRTHTRPVPKSFQESSSTNQKRYTAKVRAGTVRDTLLPLAFT